MTTTKMACIPILYATPNGGEGIAWATVSPDIAPETLDALRHMVEIAADQCIKEARILEDEGPKALEAELNDLEKNWHGEIKQHEL